MSRCLSRVLLSAVCLVVAAPACTSAPPAGGLASSTSRPSPSVHAASSVAPAPAQGTSPNPSSSSSASSPAPSITCNHACAAGTACRLTKKGPACVACAPGSAPACKDERFVATCSDDGTWDPTTDCAAQKKSCERGRCVDRECSPSALHCFEGDVYRCNAEGTGRALATRCVAVEKDGSIDASKGLCQVEKGTPTCRTKCKLPDHTIVALRDCEACRWEEVPFCATASPERGCSDWICLPGGDMSFGAVSIPCYRETEGLVVPGSDRRGACEGAGAIGTRRVTYEVCRGEQPSPATRVEPCQM